MEFNALEIPEIRDKVCRYLSTQDLVTCRRLNSSWNATAAKIFNERDPEKRPVIKITSAASKQRDISAHLKFVRERVYGSIEWIRTYKFDIQMDGSSNMSEQSIPDFVKNCVQLIKRHAQKVVSIDLKYRDMSDVLLIEILNNHHFKTMFTDLKELRFAIARLHHCSQEDPRHMVRALNALPNLTKHTLCYTRMFQEFMADDLCDYFSMALSRMNRLSNLVHSTISLNYISFRYMKALPVMTSLLFLRIFVQGEADFNPDLFEILRDKCSSLSKLHLIRLGSLASWTNANIDFPGIEPDWLENTRQLQIQFPNVRVVMEKHF